MDDSEHGEQVSGDVPEGVGPQVFRDRLDQARRHGAEHGGHITLQDQSVFLDDIDSVEAEPEGHRSRVKLRNGLIIGGLTGAAIVAALATVRYRRRHQQ